VCRRRNNNQIARKAIGQMAMVAANALLG